MCSLASASPVEENADGVTAWFTDGSTAHGDFLIAADGSHSALRPYVLGYTPQRRYAGYVNWNGLVKIDEAIAPADQWTTFVGEGKRVSLMPVSDGRFYFFFDVPLPAGLAEDRTTLRDDLSRYFSGWAPPVQRLIAALDPQTTNRIEIHDIEPFDNLVRGKVALLGDAGHSTTPDIGQGGCAAMEDAVVLGDFPRRPLLKARCASMKRSAATGCAIWCSRRANAAISPTVRIWR
jgi:FAD-dependent urate hydroxylase